MNIKDSNIAIVHDWFIQKSFGGAEKVSFILNEFLMKKEEVMCLLLMILMVKR